MKWIRYNQFDLPDEVLGAWDNFLKQNVLANVQCTPWWLSIWWKHFGQGDPDVNVLTEGEEVLAIVPLMRTQVPVKFSFLQKSVLCFIGHGFSDSLPLLVQKDNAVARKAISDLLLSFEGEYDEILVSPVNGGAPEGFLSDDQELKDWESCRIEGNPLLPLDGTWEDCLQATGKNLRKDLRKKNRRLEEAGYKPELLLERTYSDELLDSLCELAQKRFDADQHKSSFLNSTRYEFIREACAEASKRGYFACYLSKIEDRVLAFRFGFIFHGAFLDWITNYDPELFPFSIGKLMLADIIEDLYQRDVQRLNFMAGEEDYKLKWKPEVHDMHRVQWLKSSLANKMHSAVEGASRLKRSMTTDE